MATRKHQPRVRSRAGRRPAADPPARQQPCPSGERERAPVEARRILAKFPCDVVVESPATANDLSCAGTINGTELACNPTDGNGGRLIDWHRLRGRVQCRFGEPADHELLAASAGARTAVDQNVSPFQLH